jgi:polysaccharide pyruvyl transferase WcaK-like protein
LAGGELIMKRIAVCGETYSANLGDQAIHACLLHLLKSVDPGVRTVSLDISGRAASQSKLAKRGMKRRVEAWQTKPVLSDVYRLAYELYQPVRLKRLYSGSWGKELSTVQALVIGGGQLLMDDGLNFPLKLAALSKQARYLGLPTHFSACGVGSSWSAKGRKLVEGALVNAESVTLRDSLSSQRLGQMLPEIPHRVTFDPAIWAADVYPAASTTEASRFTGLCVMSKDAFNARSLNTRYIEAEWMQLWLDLLNALLKRNHQVILFTTGSRNDQQFADELFTQARLRGWRRVDLAQWPSSVPVLVDILRACRTVIAARLHAAVLANAFGIASIGLIWDQKVRAYYEDTGRPNQCFDLSQLSVTEVVKAVQDLDGHPFPQNTLEDLRDRALENVRVILDGSF